jgi:hypothetical protein
LVEQPDIVKEVKGTMAALEEIRRPYEPMIDDILTYIYHSRRKVRETTLKGQKTGIQVYDGTAISAVNLLTDGLTGYTVSKSFKWFSYALPQKTPGGQRLDSFPGVKRWLEDCEEAMYAAFLASNLYEQAPEFVRDAVTVGTVTINIDEDIAGRRVVFTVPHFRECYCAENFFGVVDTNYRKYNLTLKQMVEKFGYEQMAAVDKKFKKDYETNRHKEREVIHARFPRADFDPSKMNGRNKPFASVWVMTSGWKLLLESGTSQQQFVTWRWRKNSDEWYGRSPAWDAFVDAMTSNQAAKTNLTAAHKMVEPPMIGPADLRGAIRNGPGGWTWVSNMTADRLPRPLQENIQLPFGLEMQDRLSEKVKDHFQVDFFLMLTQAALQKVEMTATQVIEMGGEKAAVLGPRVGRLETEAMSPIHDAVFSIEQRAGRIPPPPPILQEYGGAGIDVQYLGPLSQAQRKLFVSQGIDQGLDFIGRIMAVAPDALDHVNFDNTVRDGLTARGFPQKDLNSADTVKQIRQTRQEAQDQQAQLEQAIAMAKAMPAAGKAIEPTSAVGMMMGQDA